MSPPLASTGPPKPYLQCFACLEDILDDNYPALPTGQPAQYYSCVLAVHAPHHLLVGQPCKYYTSVLQAVGKAKLHGAALADLDLSAEHHLPALEMPDSEGGDAGEEEPMCGFDELPAGQPRG